MPTNKCHVCGKPVSPTWKKTCDDCTRLINQR